MPQQTRHHSSATGSRFSGSFKHLCAHIYLWQITLITKNLQNVKRIRSVAINHSFSKNECIIIMTLCSIMFLQYHHFFYFSLCYATFKTVTIKIKKERVTFIVFKHLTTKCFPVTPINSSGSTKIRNFLYPVYKIVNHRTTKFTVTPRHNLIYQTIKHTPGYI